MARTLARALAPLLVTLSAFGLAGCGDDYGESCALPDTATVRALCSPDGDNNEATCVFRNSPECNTRLCVRYQGVQDFCSEDCSLAAGGDDCPGASLCYPVPGGGDDEGVCVPETIAGETNEQEGSGQ